MHTRGHTKRRAHERTHKSRDMMPMFEITERTKQCTASTPQAPRPLAPPLFIARTAQRGHASTHNMVKKKVVVRGEKKNYGKYEKNPVERFSAVSVSTPSQERCNKSCRMQCTKRWLQPTMTTTTPTTIRNNSTFAAILHFFCRFCSLACRPNAAAHSLIRALGSRLSLASFQPSVGAHFLCIPPLCLPQNKNGIFFCRLACVWSGGGGRHIIVVHGRTTNRALVSLNYFAPLILCRGIKAHTQNETKPHAENNEKKRRKNSNNQQLHTELERKWKKTMKIKGKSRQQKYFK